MSETHGPVGEGAIPGLATHVVHETPPARLERQWSRVSTRIGTRRRVTRWAALAMVALVAFVLGLLLRSPGAAPPTAGVPTWEGTAIESGAGGEVVTLPGGTTLALGPRTVMRVGTWSDARVTFALDRGEVTLDVEHQAGRTWVVAAAAFDVRVVGTKFTVRREPGPDGDRISVEVIRGKVQVQNRDVPGDARNLGPGESWHVDGRVGASAPSAEPTATPEPSTSASASASVAASGAPATSAAPAASSAAEASAGEGAPIWEQHANAKRYREAYDALGADGFSQALDGASAGKLERLAVVALSSGHPRDAERAYDALRKRHRGDSRAALAAFQVGRLRLDALGNPGGAAEALADAIALGPGAPFREDAEARRVQALEASGATAACVKARDAYLSRYPKGAHTTVVRARCGGR